MQRIDCVDILLVDDDPEFMELLAALLEDYELERAGDARQALTILKERKPRLLVTDLRMPGLNGFMLISEARKLIPGLPVLLLSSSIDRGSKEADILLARFPHKSLSKETPPDELLKTIRELLPT